MYGQDMSSTYMEGPGRVSEQIKAHVTRLGACGLGLASPVVAPRP